MHYWCGPNKLEKLKNLGNNKLIKGDKKINILSKRDLIWLNKSAYVKVSSVTLNRVLIVKITDSINFLHINKEYFRLKIAS